MRDAEQKAKCLGKYTQQGECPGIGIEHDLLYRSHYGDLQFLHAMASKREETAQETKRKMMLWAEFVYKIGVGAIDTTATLVSLRELPGINEIFVRPGFTVHYLLARETDRKADIKKVAIGSLLHVIQDSYSDAHTERINGCNSLAHNKGEIVSFRVYGLQNPDEHKEADIRPTWLESGDLSDNNPVSVSAIILQFWLNNADWNIQVRPFLNDKVWPLQDPRALPTSGDVECFRG